MKKYLSYLWPITKGHNSSINGTLELTWINGKKVLDSKNANYSYGNLQAVLSYGIGKIDLKNVSNVLLLGMGGGSVIKTLREDHNFHGKLTAVEIDPIVVDIACNEFGVCPDKQLSVVCEDALQFVAHNKEQFDLVIIDIFIDTEVPSSFYAESFWEQIIAAVTLDGTVLFNAGINGNGSRHTEAIVTRFKTLMNFSVYDDVQGFNTLLIGKKITEPVLREALI